MLDTHTICVTVWKRLTVRIEYRLAVAGAGGGRKDFVQRQMFWHVMKKFCILDYMSICVYHNTKLYLKIVFNCIRSILQ